MAYGVTNGITHWITKQINKPRIDLEQRIVAAHTKMVTYEHLPNSYQEWIDIGDDYLYWQKEYHSLQAEHLSKYFHYYKINGSDRSAEK